MKKTILASSLAIALLSGCMMTGTSEHASYKELQKEGERLMLSSSAEGYSPTGVHDLEMVRLAVNSGFLIALPIYERYTEELLNTPELGNFFAATENVETEEEKKAIYDSLSPEGKKIIDDYLSSSVVQEMMKGIGEVVGVLLKNSASFLAVNSPSVLAEVDWTDLIGEKNRIAHTYDQIAYLDETIVSAYHNHQIISAFVNAE